ncbi:alpha/beta fold hydrolase [Mesomycoplasma neurolyticum]|uniref:Lipase/esterase n=1 Tax=Mesomycoplasma neurolyticum TaxID=2120 RepID=A0A449A5K2_9BACT|nr:alpha/beta hydrolase [Mesomycoplasma neurolyticum]VEU59518.1 lipase/esterase [Mesomycoplasma neurolyticum]
MIKYNYPFVFIDNKKEYASPILFIHGFNSSSNAHNIFANKWKDNNYYAISLPGCSMVEPKDDDSANLKTYVKLIINFIKQNNLKNIIIFGHSMGGALAALVYSQIPEVFSKIVLIAPMNKTSLVLKDKFQKYFLPKNIDEYKTYLKILTYNIDDFLEHSDFFKITNEKIDFNFYNNLHIQELAKSLVDKQQHILVDKAYKSIKIPTLLILGEKDGIIMQEKCINYFKKTIKNIKIQIIPKTGHLIYLENFSNYYKKIKSFLND